MVQIKRHWPLILILVLAVFTRFFRIAEYMEFLGDQGRDVLIVRDFLKNGNLFFIGPQTSIGNMYLGPFYYYLFVAPGLFLFNFSPVGPAVIVAALGVLTVYLIYRFSHLWFDSSTALLAALLFALSPVVIKYSNFSWNPNIMPLFSLLYVYYLLRHQYIPAALAFILCLNSHFLALLLLPLGVLIFLKNRSRPRKLFFPALIVLLSFLPQILFDFRHQGQNFLAISAFFTRRETTINLKPYKALPEIIPLFNQVTTRILAGKNTNFGYFLTTIFTALIIYYFYLSRRHKNINYNFIVLLLWLLIGLIGLALYKQHVYDHYFGFLYPALVILFSFLLSRLPAKLYWPLAAVIIMFLLLENPFRWSPPRQLQTTRAIDRSIIARSGGQPFNFALLAKMNYDPGYQYYFKEWSAPLRTIPQQLTEQLFVVCEPFQIECQPINHPEWGIAAFGWARIDSWWEINGIKIFRLVHAQN